MTARLNRPTLLSLSRDVLAAAMEHGGDLPAGHPLLAEIGGLTGPDRERLDFYMFGARESADLIAKVVPPPAPTLAKVDPLPVAPMIPDAEYYAHGVGEGQGEGVREFVLVMAATAIGVAFVLALALCLIVGRHG